MATMVEEFNIWYQANKDVVNKRHPYDAAKLAWFASQGDTSVIKKYYENGKDKTPRILILVSSQFVGFHRWKDAPEEVKFLRDFHRHIFKVKISVEVTDPDRQVEFFMFKAKLDKVLADYNDHRFEFSCETIAQQLLERLPEACSAEVSEDGENGALVVR